MASANLEDTELDSDHRRVEIERSRSVTPSARTEFLLENMLGKLTDLTKSQSDLVKSQNDLTKSQSDMEERLSNQQTVLAKETASGLQSLAHDTALALQKLEEGQGNLVHSQTAQTAEVAEIVHRLNTLERSRASSRGSSRVASPDPYLSGTATQVPGLSAGALFPQDHLVNRRVNPNSTTGVPIFTRVKEVYEGPDRHRTNILSSSSHDIVLESHTCTSRAPSLELPRTFGLDSRSEAEVDSNRTLTRTHDPGLEVAPQCYEETVQAGVSSLRGAPSDWPVRVNGAETYSGDEDGIIRSTSDFRFRPRETDTFDNRVFREQNSQMIEDRRENISESRFRPIESINVNGTRRLDSRHSVTETETVMERPNYSVNFGEISGVNSGASVRRSNAMSGRSSVKSRVMEPIYEEREFVGTQSYPYRSYSPIRSHAVCLCSWSLPPQPVTYTSCARRQLLSTQPSSALIYEAQPRMSAPCFQQQHPPWSYTEPGISDMPAPLRSSASFVSVATQTRSQDISAMSVTVAVTCDTTSTVMSDQIATSSSSSSSQPPKPPDLPSSSSSSSSIPPTVSLSEQPATSTSSSSLSSTTEKPRSYLKLPSYNGTTPLATFLKKFDVCKKSNSWGPKQQLEQLTYALTDNAAQILWEENDDEEQTVEQLLKKLQDRYGTSHSLALFRTQLSVKKQSGNETIEETAADIQRLMCLAYPGKPSPHSEALGVQSFLASLKDRSLSTRVAEFDPQNLQQALERALKLQALERAERERSGSLYQNKYRVQQIKECDPNEQQNSLEKRLAALEKWLDGDASNRMNGGRMQFNQQKGRGAPFNHQRGRGAFGSYQRTPQNHHPSSYAQNSYRSPDDTGYHPPPPQNAYPMQSSTNADYPPLSSNMNYSERYMPSDARQLPLETRNNDQFFPPSTSVCPPQPLRIGRITSSQSYAPSFGRASARLTGRRRPQYWVRSGRAPNNRVCFLCKEGDHDYGRCMKLRSSQPKDQPKTPPLAPVYHTEQSESSDDDESWRLVRAIFEGSADEEESQVHDSAESECSEPITETHSEAEDYPTGFGYDEPEGIVLNTVNSEDICPERQSSKINESQSACLELWIYNKLHSAVLDSGSQTSIFPAELISKRLIKPTEKRLVAINQTEVEIVGEAWVPCRIDEYGFSVLCLISPTVKQMILGLPFMVDQKVKIDMEREEVCLKGNWFPIGQESQELSCRRVVIRKSPRSQAQHVYVDKLKPFLGGIVKDVGRGRARNCKPLIGKPRRGGRTAKSKT